MFGLGVIVGNLMAGWLDTLDAPRGSSQTNWRAYYAIPGWVTLACLVALLVFYPNRTEVRQPEGMLAD